MNRTDAFPGSYTVFMFFQDTNYSVNVLFVLLDSSDTFYEFGTKILERRVKGLKYNLAHCCNDLKIDTEDLRLHRADSDCIATYRLFEELRTELV